MRALTPRGGVDPPSWWCHTCLGFWYLILEHVRFACITLDSLCHIFSYALHSRNHICFIPKNFLLLSWENSEGISWGWQNKHVERLLFYLGNSEPLLEDRFDLTTHARFRFWFFTIEHFLLFLCRYFLIKKNGVEDAYIFFLIAFQILHVFLPDISVHYALIKYACI